MVQPIPVDARESIKEVIDRISPFLAKGQREFDLLFKGSLGDSEAINFTAAASNSGGKDVMILSKFLQDEYGFKISNYNYNSNSPGQVYIKCAPV